jgi:threonine dehydrogenase-like Zn-dependent dehydrogenase
MSIARTGAIGVDRAIDAVGVAAQDAHHGLARNDAKEHAAELGKERQRVAPKARRQGKQRIADDARTHVLDWGVEAPGQLSIIGVYPPMGRIFPIGKAMNKNPTVKMGSCDHRRHYAILIDLVRSGAVDPSKILTNVDPMQNAIAAYDAFDGREPG